MTEPLTNNSYQSAFNAGKETIIQAQHKDVPVIIHPKGTEVTTLETLDERTREQPRFLKQTLTALSAESFVDYFNRFATEHSVVLVNIESLSFTGIIDYHESNSMPRHCHHKVVYQCPKTPEIGKWLESNNKKMNQEEFALFIEDSQREIMEPNAAEMLEIAASLKASNAVDFKSAVRLDNGQVQFNYTENISGQAGFSGQFSIPEKIKLNVRAFLNGAPYAIEARFRYRITPQGLVMWYTLISPNLVLDDALQDVLTKIKAGMTTGYLIEAAVRG